MSAGTAFISGWAQWWGRIRSMHAASVTPAKGRTLAFNAPLPACTPAVDNAWRNGKTSSPAGPASDSASGAAVEASHGSAAHGSAALATAGSGKPPIPELPFAAGLLTPADYKIETGAGGLGCMFDRRMECLTGVGKFQNCCCCFSNQFCYMSRQLLPACLPLPFNADPASGKPALLGSGHFGNVRLGRGQAPAAASMLAASTLPVIPSTSGLL